MPQYGPGSVTFGASGILVTSSDSRLKNKTRSLENGLDKVNRINPTFFKWKEDSGHDRKIIQEAGMGKGPQVSEYLGNEHLGFIAQEVKEVLPEIYAYSEEEPEKMLGIDDRALIALLFKATQELSTENTALEARLTALENE